MRNLRPCLLKWAIAAALPFMILAGSFAADAPSGARSHPDTRPAYGAESLKIDGRYSREIRFDPIGVRIPISRKNAYVRVDPPVEDVEEHQELLFREIGHRPAGITYTNLANYGRQVYLMFRDGKECSFIWVLEDRDPRLVQMRREHEKYHAVVRLAPEHAGSLSEAILSLGFKVKLADYDEETAATIVEVLSLHRLGVRLEDISGSDLVRTAAAILIAARTGAAAAAAASSSTPEMQINVEWPQGNQTIEIPLEWIDGLPAVRCRINGKPAALTVDTGLRESAVYRDRLRRFGVEIIAGNKQADTAATGADDDTICGRHEITFDGGLRMIVTAGLVIHPGTAANELDGILGVKVVRALNGIIDLGRPRLILSVQKPAPDGQPREP